MDDEEIAYPFLEKSRELGIRNLSLHKGLPLPGRSPEGKPKHWYWLPDDVLKAAKDFPDLNFIVYHSGMQHMQATLPPGKSGLDENGYIPWTTDMCKARMEDPELTNVYMELGTVFAFSVITHPEVAGHLLGQIIQAYGADHVIWGTDCIWWGSPQWLIEAFRRFQIPSELQDNFGYAPITDADRDIIFGRNLAGLFNVDVDAAMKAFPDDAFTEMKQAYIDAGKAGGSLREVAFDSAGNVIVVGHGNFLPGRLAGAKTFGVVVWNG